MITTFFVKKGYVTFHISPQSEKKQFYCKVIDDFNQCLIGMNHVAIVTDNKIADIWSHQSARSSCLNYSYYALSKKFSLQFLDEQLGDLNSDNDIHKVLAIPETEWRHIISSLADCTDAADRGRERNRVYNESVCYIKSSYKMLKYCYK